MRKILVLFAVLISTSLNGLAHADPCEVDDAGGTVVLPPIGCDYLSPDEVHVIIDGLPPETTLELKPIHKEFLCDLGYAGTYCSELIPPGLCEQPGGGLGGNVDCFESVLEFEVKGTGLLAGFSRVVTFNDATTEVHSGPRTPGASVQTFPTEMVSLAADLGPDPDFALLEIRAGSFYGLPSSGETTLTQKASGKWNVDSFFDVSYQIDFVGAPGSALDGMSGSTQNSLRMGSNLNPCDVIDNGTGTVTLPPAGCEYLSPDEVHEIINGLPVGTTIVFEAIHRNFICGNPIGTCTIPLPGGVCEGPGGSLGGNADCFQSEAEFSISGTGALAGFSRTISLQLDTEVHTGPRNPGDPVQSFPNDMYRLSGQLFGDPDFCVLNINGGSQFGLPGPGITTLTDNGDGTFAVDSFFDVSYTIDFQGCPGSALEGFGGTTTGALKMRTGIPTAAAPPPPAVPSIQGSWQILFVLLLAGTSVFAITRRIAAQR